MPRALLVRARALGLLVWFGGCVLMQLQEFVASASVDDDAAPIKALEAQLLIPIHPLTHPPPTHPQGHSITKQGLRPEFPPGTPFEYQFLACRCWETDPIIR